MNDFESCSQICLLLTQSMLMQPSEYLVLCDFCEFVKLLCGSLQGQQIKGAHCCGKSIGLNVIFILSVDLAPVHRGYYEISPQLYRKYFM